MAQMVKRTSRPVGCTQTAMTSAITIEQRFPLSFTSLLAESMRFYKGFFLPFLLLGVITYLPFLILGYFLSFQLLEVMDMIHGAMLDMVIFLALPTIFMSGKVFPWATVSLFQRFFSSAVTIALAQITLMLMGLALFFALSPGLILFGAAPALFLIFAGQFLVLRNQDKLFDVGASIVASASLVKKQFFLTFWNFLSISLLLNLPLVLFSTWYLFAHPDMASFLVKVQAMVEPDPSMQGEIFVLADQITGEEGFRYGRLVLYLLVRPLKSLFMAFLFLACLSRIAPERALSFLGLGAAPAAEPIPPEDPA